MAHILQWGISDSSDLLLIHLHTNLCDPFKLALGPPEGYFSSLTRRTDKVNTQKNSCSG